MPASGMPEFREIVGDARALNEVVSDGHLDLVELSGDIVLFCDRDEPQVGKGYSFTIAGHFVHGDAFFVRRQDASYISLTDDDVEKILAYPSR